MCIRKTERRNWELEQQGSENIRIQNELLSIEKQRLHEQREFQQKILEQSLTNQQAFKSGYDKKFEEGDIQFGATWFEFTFPSPYIDEQLSIAFFEGAGSKFSTLFPQVDWDDIFRQISWIGNDVRASITEKADALISNALYNGSEGQIGAAGFMRSDVIKNYAIMATSGVDGESYCIHLLSINCSVGFDQECNFFISGVNDNIFPGAALNNEFLSSLNQAEILGTLNGREELQKIKKYDKIIKRRIVSSMRTYPIGQILQYGIVAFAIYIVYKLIT
jgi:hypothetical protein